MQEIVKPEPTALEVLENIASSFWDDSQQYRRDILVVSKIKKIGQNKDDMRAMNLYEATAYVVACRDLHLNPMLNHVIMLEGNLYITLQWHLQNAHASGNLKSIIVQDVSGWEVDKRPSFKKLCTIETNSWATFTAEGYSDAKTVKGAQYKTDLFLEQMAEARAMRRCLARAFPVWIWAWEDTVDSVDMDVKTLEISEEKVKRISKKTEPIEVNVAPTQPEPTQPEPVAEVTPSPKEDPKEEPKTESIWGFDWISNDELIDMHADLKSDFRATLDALRANWENEDLKNKKTQICDTLVKINAEMMKRQIPLINK